MTLREREHIKTNRSHTASLAQIEKLSCPDDLGDLIDNLSSQIYLENGVDLVAEAAWVIGWLFE
jgi:hypothetical protein